MPALKDRISAVANRSLAEERSPRFISGGKPETYNRTEYQPLMVRTRDVVDSLQVLASAEKAVTDVAALVDVVVAQWEVIANQADELARLRADVEALRTERVTADVTKQVNEALLGAAQKGVLIEEFDFQISSADELYEQSVEGMTKQSTSQGAEQKNSKGALELGAVLDVLKGAHLGGEHVAGAVANVRSRLERRKEVTRSTSRQAAGTLRAKRVGRDGLRND